MTLSIPVHPKIAMHDWKMDNATDIFAEAGTVYSSGPPIWWDLQCLQM